MNPDKLRQVENFLWAVKLPFKLAFLTLLGYTLAGCAPKKMAGIPVTPFSVSNYCTGSLTLKNFQGLQMTGPSECGEIKVTAKAIDSIPTDQTLMGRAYLTLGVQPDSTDPVIKGEIDQILLNDNLPPCMIPIIKEKEWDVNAAVSNFFEKTNVLNYFLGKDQQGAFVDDSAITFIDATAIHETMAGLDAREKNCISDYAPDSFNTSFFETVSAYPSLAELTADGEFSKSDLCTTISTAQMYMGNIQDPSASPLNDLYASLDCGSGN